MTGNQGITTDSFNGHIETLGDKTYIFDQYAPVAYTVNSLVCKTSGGTGMLTMKIDSTAISNINGVYVSNTEQTHTASGNNSVSVGNTLSMSCTGINGAVDYTFTLKITR